MHGYNSSWHFICSVHLLILLIFCSSQPRNRYPLLRTKTLGSNVHRLWKAYCDAPVTNLKGCGPKTASSLKKLNIETFRDILLHLPNNIRDRSQLCSLGGVGIGEYGTFEVILHSYVDPVGKRPAILSTTDVPTQLPLDILYFTMKITSRNFAWYSLKRKLGIGSKFRVSGKVSVCMTTGRWQIQNPDFIHEVLGPIEDEAFTAEPRYSLSGGLKNSKLKALVQSALRTLDALVDKVGDEKNFEWLSEEVLRELKMSSLIKAIVQAHEPANKYDLMLTAPSRKRLAFEELVSLYLNLNLMKKNNELLTDKQGVNTSYSVVPSKSCKSSLSKTYLEKVLPFSLTSAQLKSLHEIISDLEKDQRMVRLLQGDVGSGKTVVSLSAILNVLDAGKIAIIMAPTIVLARQHYEIISTCLSNIRNLSQVDKTRKWNGKLPNVGIVTGSTKEEERRRIKEGLCDGEYGVLVGTHTLFQHDFYSFLEPLNSIGLVVIDEEQRFGVDQRDKMARLSNVLFTTATPIPRSLSLILQDVVEISTINDKPATKRHIETILLEEKLSNDVIKRIVSNIPFGTKAIWVTPKIGPTNVESMDPSPLPSRTDDIENISAMGVSAYERYEEFSKLCPGKVGLLHGRLNSTAKVEIIEKFRSGEINVLVSTTVVEVGLDIPDASICVIDQADMFGMSQLHQIRGRVGRGAAPVKERFENAFCILLYGKSRDKVAIEKECAVPEKLKILKSSNDGFYISAVDLSRRGPGDFFGSKQHGISELRFPSSTHHWHLVEWAKLVANEIYSSGADVSFFLTRGLFSFDRKKIESDQNHQ